MPSKGARKPLEGEVAEQAWEQISGQNALRLRRDFALVQRRNIISAATHLALTEDTSGALVLLDGATQAVTLPIATDLLKGIYWDFQQTVAATNTTITAVAGDLYSGGVVIQSDTATAGDFFAADASNDVIITLNGGTTGGALGGRMRIECGGLDLWYVSGVLHGVGATMATPFS